MVGVVGILLVLTWAGLALGAAVVATHRARASADLAALAGAVLLAGGSVPEQACAASSSVAERNGARLASCAAHADGAVVVVTSTRVPLALPGTSGRATGTARAGPAP